MPNMVLFNWSEKVSPTTKYLFLLGASAMTVAYDKWPAFLQEVPLYVFPVIFILAVLSLIADWRRGKSMLPDLT